MIDKVILADDVPVKKGQKYPVEKGELVHTTHPKIKSLPCKRDRKITVNHIIGGYRSSNGEILPPRIVWSGTSGYWFWVHWDGVTEGVSDEEANPS